MRRRPHLRARLIPAGSAPSPDSYALLTGGGEPPAPISAAERDILFEPLRGRSLALAVSGGADSMALLHLVAGWWFSGCAGATGDRDLAAPIVVTVDHGLRAESAAEAERVAAAAERLGLCSKVLRWSGPYPFKGLQAAARAARYGLIADALASEVGRGQSPRFLVTAHHQDDQAETFLMRLARGSGIDGLAAMRSEERLELPASPARPEGGALIVLRPLLNVSKSRLTATLKAAGLEWSEDPSNARRDFERVRIRAALATLERLGLTEAAIASSAARIAHARTAIHSAACAAAAAIDWHDGVYGAISHATLVGHPDEVGIRVLACLIEGNGGTTPRPRLAELERLYARIRSAKTDAGRAAATLGGCRIDWRTGGLVRVWREDGRAGARAPQALQPGERVHWDRRFEISLSASASRPLTITPLGHEGWRRLRAARPDLARLRYPPGAAAMLPACRSGDDLVAVGAMFLADWPHITIRATRRGPQPIGP